MIKRRFAQFAVMAGLLAMSATATNASVTVSYDTSTVTIAQQEVSFTENVTVAQFNSSLGTLLNAVIHLSASGTTTLDLKNNSGSTKNYTNVMLSVPVTVTGGGVTASATLTGGPYSGTIPAHTSNPTLTSAPTAIVQSSGVVPNLAPFIGNGVTTIPLTFSAGDVVVSGSVGSNVGITPDAFVGGSVYVTYTYTAAVPEPGTLVAFTSGLVCLGLVRLRRRKSA
jgi:hypothetical protein